MFIVSIKFRLMSYICMFLPQIYKAQIKAQSPHTKLVKINQNNMSHTRHFHSAQMLQPNLTQSA